MYLTLRHFELVEALCNFGTMSRAATALGLTQPAVSRALKALEDQIGGRLFEVSPKGLVPTPLAQIFVRRYAQLTQPIHEIIADIESLKADRHGRIVMGAGIYGSVLSAFSAIAKLHNRQPGLIFDLVERDWRDVTLGILSHEIDIGLIDVEVAERSSELAFDPLPNHPCSVVVRADHPLAQSQNVTIEDLKRYSYCGPHPSSWAAERSGEHAELFGARSKTQTSYAFAVPLAVHTLGAVRRIILESDAFGIIPTILLSGELSHENPGLPIKKLVGLDIPELGWLRTNYGLVRHRQKTLHPSLLDLIALVKDIEHMIYARETALFPDRVAASR